MKTCSRCKECHPISNYSKKQSQHDGLYPQCRQCKSIAQAKYRSKNKDAIVAYQKNIVICIKMPKEPSKVNIGSNAHFGNLVSVSERI